MSETDLVAGLKNHLESYRLAISNLDKKIEVIKKADEEIQNLISERAGLLNELSNFKNMFWTLLLVLLQDKI